MCSGIDLEENPKGRKDPDYNFQDNIGKVLYLIRKVRNVL